MLLARGIFVFAAAFAACDRLIIVDTNISAATGKYITGKYITYK